MFSVDSFMTQVLVHFTLVTGVTSQQETLEIQPYQKAYSVSGLHWGLVAGLDFVVVYGHINVLKVKDITGQLCGFNFTSRTEPNKTLLCSMTIQPQTVCLYNPRRHHGNLCYCEDRKRESMTFVMNVTVRKEMNDSTIFFWLEADSTSIKIPEPVFETIVVNVLKKTPPPPTEESLTRLGTLLDVESPYLRLIGIFQILTLVFFAIATAVLIAVFVKYSKRSTIEGTAMANFRFNDGKSIAVSTPDHGSELPDNKSRSRETTALDDNSDIKKMSMV